MKKSPEISDKLLEEFSEESLVFIFHEPLISRAAAKRDVMF